MTVVQHETKYASEGDTSTQKTMISIYKNHSTSKKPISSPLYKNPTWRCEREFQTNRFCKDVQKVEVLGATLLHSEDVSKSSLCHYHGPDSRRKNLD